MMKLFNGCLLALLFAFVSCGEDKPAEHFALIIGAEIADDSLQYVLTDSSLAIFELPGVYESRKPEVVFTCVINNTDTLPLIALLDIKTYDCREQHALNAVFIGFSKDGKYVTVDPNINHPKEIDYAVRLINSLVPPEYKLEFIDMQPAIEPDGKLRL